MKKSKKSKNNEQKKENVNHLNNITFQDSHRGATPVRRTLDHAIG
jgi:hypothetical protein